jgi:hypothetical protein
MPSSYECHFISLPAAILHDAHVMTPKKISVATAALFDFMHISPFF